MGVCIKSSQAQLDIKEGNQLKNESREEAREQTAKRKQWKKSTMGVDKGAADIKNAS